MFSTSKQPVDPAHFQYFAESLADLLSAGGDGHGANQVLSVVSKQVNTPSIALRRAEFHLQRQDPASALSALIPAWEAGYDDDELELSLVFARYRWVSKMLSTAYRPGRAFRRSENFTLIWC